MVLAAILSIDTKQQDDDRGRQDAAEGAQTEGRKLQRKERRAKARCGLAPSRMSMCMREICSLLPLWADDGGGGKHEMGGAHGEDTAGEWIGLLGWRG